MEDAVLQRIKEFMKLRKLSVNSLSRVLNLRQTTVNNYFLEKRRVSFELISAFLFAFPDVSAEWLLRGKGQMFGSESTINIDMSGDNHITGNGNATNGATITSAPNNEIYEVLIAEKDNTIKLMQTQIDELRNDKLFLQNIIAHK